MSTRIDNYIHHCHARGCVVPCAPEKLMCFAHWRLVPSSLRARVWATYRPGQCDLKPSPSREWHAAADAAIEAVVKVEARLKAERIRMDLEMRFGEDHQKACRTASEMAVSFHGCRAHKGYLIDRFGQSHQHFWASWFGAIVDPLAEYYDGPVLYEEMRRDDGTDSL